MSRLIFLMSLMMFLAFVATESSSQKQNISFKGLVKTILADPEFEALDGDEKLRVLSVISTIVDGLFKQLNKHNKHTIDSKLEN